MLEPKDFKAGWYQVQSGYTELFITDDPATKDNFIWESVVALVPSDRLLVEEIQTMDVNVWGKISIPVRHFRDVPHTWVLLQDEFNEYLKPV